MLFSAGKDSIVLLRLAEKAFRPLPLPFPVMHVDTGHNFDEGIEFRDRRVTGEGDNTAETTATGYLYSDHAGNIAVLVKSTNNALIGFVVLGFALHWAARGQVDKIAPGAKAKAAFVWDKFPKFVLGFLAVSAIATAHWLTKGQTANLANASKWAFLLTFAGVGLNTDIRQIARTGWRPLLVAVIGLIAVASVSLGIVLLTSRVLHWGVGV